MPGMRVPSKRLAPLGERYAAAGLLPPKAELVPGPRLPQPHRRLLVHERDMTSTLERFHKATIRLAVLSRQRRGNRYGREVVLKANGEPVEFGAIVIHLDRLTPAARAMVLAGERPLGAVLQECGIGVTSRPTAFFRVAADAVMARALEVPGGSVLFGRCNELRNARGRTIADIVEILPPAEGTASACEFRQTRIVAFGDTDTAGIVHFANYFRFMEETEHAFYRALGLSVFPRRGERIVGWPRVAASCEYSAPLRFEDEVEIHLSVREKGARSIAYEFIFRHTGAETARGRITVVSVSWDPATRRMKSVPIPRAFDEKIRVAPR